MRSSTKIQQGSWCSRLKDYFNVRPVIIEVRPGETREDSWKRHLMDHPESTLANIKVFNRANYDLPTPNAETGHMI